LTAVLIVCVCFILKAVPHPAAVRAAGILRGIVLADLLNRDGDELGKIAFAELIFGADGDKDDRAADKDDDKKTEGAPAAVPAATAHPGNDPNSLAAAPADNDPNSFAATPPAAPARAIAVPVVSAATVAVSAAHPGNDPNGAADKDTAAARE
jgi:hypothetical protein